MRRYIPIILVSFLLIIGLTIELDSVPGPWWDEGWTMSVAHNWVTLGHYGRLLDGERIGAGLAAAFPVTGSIALSFWLFDTGVFQARMTMVLYSLSLLALLYYLANRLFNRKIAFWTLLLFLILAPHADSNLLLTGRQVLGEVPALCFLLLGYVWLHSAVDKHPAFLILAVAFWSMALVTKAQVEPFWILSMLIPTAFAIYHRRWQVTGMLVVGLVAAKIGSLGWLIMLSQMESGHRVPVVGLTQAVAIALTTHSRLTVLYEILRFGLPTVLGLAWTLYSFATERESFTSATSIVKLALFVLAGSWFAWYASLSVGWPRYFAPPAYLSAMFVAAMLSDWSVRFNWRLTIQRCSRAFRSFESLRALMAVLLIVVSSIQTAIVFYEAFFILRDNSLTPVVQFLNNETPKNARIETYEAELFPFLHRRYHYPPDQFHVELIQKNSLGKSVNVSYDPLNSNPEYLVIGRINRFWGLYDPYLKKSNFYLVRTVGRYQIFQRIR